MSDTPRTDAEEFKALDGISTPVMVVKSRFARHLEYELDKERRCMHAWRADALARMEYAEQLALLGRAIEEGYRLRCNYCCGNVKACYDCPGGCMAKSFRAALAKNPGTTAEQLGIDPDGRGKGSGRLHARPLDEDGKIEFHNPSSERVTRFHQPCAAHQGMPITFTVRAVAAVGVCMLCHPDEPVVNAIGTDK